jgi:hypothetical protein
VAIISSQQYRKLAALWRHQRQQWNVINNGVAKCGGVDIRRSNEMAAASVIRRQWRLAAINGESVAWRSL